MPPAPTKVRSAASGAVSASSTSRQRLTSASSRTRIRSSTLAAKGRSGAGNAASRRPICVMDPEATPGLLFAAHRAPSLGRCPRSLSSRRVAARARCCAAHGADPRPRRLLRPRAGCRRRPGRGRGSLRRCRGGTGLASKTWPSPTSVSTTDYEMAVAIASGSANAQQALARGRLRIGGDLEAFAARASLLLAVRDTTATLRSDTTFGEP